MAQEQEINLKLNVDTQDLQFDLSKLKDELEKSLGSDAFVKLDENAEQFKEILSGINGDIGNVSEELSKLSDTALIPVEANGLHIALEEIMSDVQNVTTALENAGTSAESLGNVAEMVNGISNAFSRVSDTISQNVMQQEAFGEKATYAVRNLVYMMNTAQGALGSNIFDEPSDKINQIGIKLESSTEKAENLVERISSLGNEIPTAQFTELQSQLETTKAQADEISDKFAEMGKNIEVLASLSMEQLKAEHITAQWQIDISQYQQLQSTIQDIESEMRNLEESGEAYTNQLEQNPEILNRLTSEAQALSHVLESQLSTLESQAQKESELTEKAQERAQAEAEKEALKAYKEVLSVLKTIGKYAKEILNTTKQIITAVTGALISGLTKVVDLAKRIGTSLSSGVKNLGSGFKEVSKGASDSAESMAKFTKRMILLAVGTRSVFALLRKIRTEVVQGMTDAINSVDTVKSSVDGLKQTFANLKGQISMAFLPLIEVAIPYIQQVCAWLSNMINLIAQAIAALTGASTWRKVTGVDQSKMTGAGGSKKKGKTTEEKNAEKQAKVDKQNAKKQAAYDKKVANAYKKADEQEAKVNERNAKALERYEKAQRKAAEADKKRLSGLDILNNMTTNETEIEEPELEEFDKEAYLADLLDGIGELELAVADLEDDLGAGGIGAISWVEEEIDQRVKDFIEWLKSMWETGDFSELGRWIGEHLRDWLNAIPWDEIQEKARKVGKSIATLIDGLVSTEGLAEAIGRTIAQGYLTVFHFLDELVTDLPWAKIGKFLADGLNEFGRVITENWDVIYHTLTQLADGLADFINSFVDNFKFDYISEVITKALSTIADAITTFAQKVNFRKLGSELGNQLMKILGDAETWGKVGTAIGSALNGIVNLIIGFFQNISYSDIKASISNFMKKLKEAFDFDSFKDDLYNVIVNLWTTIRQALIDLSSKITEWIGSVNWYELGQKIGNKIKEILEDKELLSKVGEAAGSIIGALVDALAGVLDTVSWGDVIRAFQTLWDSFKDKVDMGKVAKMLLGALRDAFVLNIPSILGGVGSLIAGSLFKSFFIKQAVSKALAEAGLEGLGAGAGKTLSQSLIFGSNSALKSIGGIKGLLFGNLGTVGTTAAEVGLQVGTGILGGVIAFFKGVDWGKQLGAWFAGTELGQYLHWDKDIYAQYEGISGTCKLIIDTIKATGDAISMAFTKDEVGANQTYAEKVVNKMGIMYATDEVEKLVHQFENGEKTASEFNAEMQDLIRSTDNYGKMGKETHKEAEKFWKEQNKNAEETAQAYVDSFYAMEDGARRMQGTVETTTASTTDAFNRAQNDVKTYETATVQGFREIEDSYEKSKVKADSYEEAIRQGTELSKQAMNELHTAHVETANSTDQAASSAQGLKSSLDSTADSAENLADKVQLSADMVASMLDQLKSQIADADWAEIWSPVKTGFEEFWNTFKGDVNTSVQELLGELPNMVSSGLNMSSILEPINTEISEFMNTVKTTVSSKMGEITKAVQDGITNLKLSLSASLKGINESFANAFKGISQMVSTVMQNMSKIFSTGLQTVARSYGQGWESMVRTTHSAVQQMINMINSLMNQLRKVPQALSQTMQQMDKVSQQMNKLSNVNTSSNKLSNLVNKLKGSVTPYASGGVIPPTMAEHLALLGDNKRETEVVSPLSTMKQAMAEVLAEMNMGSGDSGDIVVQIDGREVFRAVREQSDQYKKRTGNYAFG